jgi:hypothetical protein
MYFFTPFSGLSNRFNSVANRRIAAWFFQVTDFTLSLNSVATLTNTLFCWLAPRVNPTCAIWLTVRFYLFEVISGFDFAFMLFASCLFAFKCSKVYLNTLTQHFCVCCIKRYLKRSILVHHGLNDKTRIVSGTALKAILSKFLWPFDLFYLFFWRVRSVYWDKPC